MKECPSCKTKNRNDAEFCTECGADLKDVPATTDEWAAAAGSLLNKAKEVAAKAEATKAAGVSSGGWDAAVDTPTSAPVGSAPQKGSSILVDQSESIVATIGNNYLQNFLMGGNVERGVGLLTQKRFYFKGKSYTGSGKDMKSSTQEGVVSIDDIALSEFIYTRPTGLLIAAIIFTIGIVTIPIALFFYIKYFISRQTLFVISFPGGGFGFDVKYYPITDIRDFQRQLHLLKDHRKEGGDA